MIVALAAATPVVDDHQAFARRFLADEAKALLVRLSQLQPLALVDVATHAAMPRACGLAAIDRHLARAQHEAARSLRRYDRWLQRGPGRAVPSGEAQRRLSVLRMQIMALHADYDIFTDALSQRSESRNGIWLAGLDVVARDALALPRRYYDTPELLCYLERGRGAAIRRLRTRLPSGSPNPVAVIRVPRERLLGAAIASSLVHEVGHQGSALLDLPTSVRPTLRALQLGRSPERTAWSLLERWIGEILADLWSVARVGVGATLGLIGVLSLPVPFVFRITTEDPHPCPWLRVQLSAALGQALYPDPQWQRLGSIWRTLYPLSSAPRTVAALLAQLEQMLPRIASLLVAHRPARLHGAALGSVLAAADRAPSRLRADASRTALRPHALFGERPSRALAILGQARADGRLEAQREAAIVDRLLNYWALAQTRADASHRCSRTAA